MHSLKIFVGLFALICSFSAIDGKTAGKPFDTLNKPAEVVRKTASSSARTL